MKKNTFIISLTIIFTLAIGILITTNPFNTSQKTGTEPKEGKIDLQLSEITSKEATEKFFTHIQIPQNPPKLIEKSIMSKKEEETNPLTYLDIYCEGTAENSNSKSYIHTIIEKTDLKELNIKNHEEEINLNKIKGTLTSSESEESESPKSISYRIEWITNKCHYTTMSYRISKEELLNYIEQFLQ